MKINKIIAVLIAGVILCSCLFAVPFAVSAEKAVPTVHPTNTNFLEDLSGFGTDLWGVDANTYVNLDKDNKNFSWSFFNGPFLTQGVSLNTNHASLLSADLNVSNLDGRLDVIFRAKGVTDYFTVHIYRTSVFLYRYQHGAGDILLDKSPVAYTRKENGDAHIDILNEGDKVSVWVDGVNYFDEYELTTEGHYVTLGFATAIMAVNQDVCTVSNYKLSYVENEDLFMPLPVFPAGNADLIKDVTALTFPFGAFGSYNSATKTVTLQGQSTGASGMMNNLNFDVTRAYVVQGTIEVPKSGTCTRVVVAGASAANNVSVYFFDRSLAVYGLGNYSETASFASSSFSRKFNVIGGTSVPEKMDFAVLMANDTISVWVNGKNVLEKVECSMNYYTANIGFNITGLSGSEKATFSNLMVYYYESDLDYMDNMLGVIPELTLANYREMRTKIPELRQEVNKYINEGGNVSYLENYDKLLKAEADLNIFDNDFKVQDLIYTEDCIANIPKITPENYQYQLENSEEYTLAYATEMITWLLEEYPDLSIDNISNYNQYLKALTIANNNGVSPNLFDNCTGVSSVSGGITTYDPEFNRAVVKGTSFYKFDNVSIDPEKIYVYEMDVIQTKTNGHTRIAFKGTDANDYLYVGFIGDSAIMYDPLYGQERNILGSGKFVRPTDRAFHVKIITGPGYAVVICDDKVIISATIETRYTGQFFAVYSYDNASATFDNINLYYYENEKVDYSGKSVEDNLLYGATSIHGFEAGLGFYGTIDTETDTINILSNGAGGTLDGVTIDYTKPVVFTTDIKTDSDTGVVNLMVSGKDSLTGLTVGIGDKAVTLCEYEYGLPGTELQSVYFSRKANQSYKVEVIYEDGAISLFIDGVCYYHDISGDDEILGNVIGFFNREINGSSSMANLSIKYATEEQLQNFKILKDNMPEHKDPTIDEDDDYDYEDDYIVEEEIIIEEDDTVSEENEEDDEFEYEDEYEDEEDEEDEYVDEYEDEYEDEEENNKKKKVIITTEQIDVKFYVVLGCIIGGVILLGGGAVAFFLIRRKKAGKI